MKYQVNQKISLANPTTYDAPDGPLFLRPHYMEYFLDSNLVSMDTYKLSAPMPMSQIHTKIPGQECVLQGITTPTQALSLPLVFLRCFPFPIWFDSPFYDLIRPTFYY